MVKVRVTYILKHTFPSPYTDDIEVSDTTHDTIISALNEKLLGLRIVDGGKAPSVRSILSITPL